MRGMVLGEARKPFTELRRGVAEYCVLAVLREAESYAFDRFRADRLKLLLPHAPGEGLGPAD